MRKEMDAMMKQKEQEDMLKNNPEQLKRENQLITKIANIFRQRECSFYDAFQDHYDSLSDKNVLSIKVFKAMVNTLNLPLTVQDHRILRRIADPQGLGKVDLTRFCGKFETMDLRQARLNKTLDRVATAFYI
jgi:hypothetical protein